MADDGWVLRVAVQTILGENVHHVRVEPHDGLSASQVAARMFLEVRAALDEGRSVLLSHPVCLYPPDKIFMLGFDFTNPQANAKEIANFWKRIGDPEGEYDDAQGAPPA